MKIGILTQPLHANYGGILQAYALQAVLKRMGHEPWIVQRQFNSHSFYFWCRSNIAGKIRRFIQGEPQVKWLYRKRESYLWKNIRNFIDQNIYPVTNIIFSTKELLKDYTEHRYDAYIIGSDQVWRPMYSPKIENFYLDFVEDIPVKKIAYAASFGVGHWEYTTKQTVKCKSLAAKLDAISVRENSGVQLCEDYLGIKAVEVLDPTLLLDKEEYSRLCREIPVQTEPFLGVYILDITPSKQSFVENFAKINNLQVKFFKQYEPVENWLAMFRDAAFILTDSFHGSVFSILYQKNFLSITNINRGATRFHSLLSKFDLLDRIITTEYVGPPKLVDWTRVEECRSAYRNDSIAFLNNSLL